MPFNSTDVIGLEAKLKTMNVISRAKVKQSFSLLGGAQPRHRHLLGFENEPLLVVESTALLQGGFQ